MELEPPVTPSAPFTPGAQLELGLQDWSDPDHIEENPDRSYQQDTFDLDVMMDLQTSGPPSLLRPPSPIACPGAVH